MVLPNDTNTLNDLMGGKLMQWMDIVSAIAAQKHCNSTVVTASVDNISFSKPIKIGDVVTLKAQVTRAFNTSMEIKITVWAEDIPRSIKILSHSAFFTFVAVDRDGRPRKVPELLPENEEEQELYEGAQKRRQLRLLLANRIKPEDAHDLKTLFKA